MIITKTPYRISFFGGGTDHPAWFKENGGKVLATTFDKYCYISVRPLPPFFEHKYRIVYSQIESIDDIKDIEHPAVKEVLKYYNCVDGLEIHHDGDLPARSGLGSSSSFTVGMLNAMNALKGIYSSPNELSSTAIHIEQNLIKECVGSQDQISAAYGGFNEIEFYKDGTFSVEPKIISQDRSQNLNDHLMLFFTGISRFSSEIAKSQILNMNKCRLQMHELRDMVDEASSILGNPNTPLEEFGKLLNKAWENKRSLSDRVSNTQIDELYSAAIKAGALGGKILGAGGGGFILFFAKPENQDRVKAALDNLTFVPFKFENTGSKVVLYQPNGF
ncbi:kinase [Candidatus Thioglobus sp.]|nr:kinase [Candidatus Thioglobus sp.]